MKSKLTTPFIAIGTMLLISSSCKKTTVEDLTAEYLGNYRIEYTYEEPYFNGTDWDYNTITNIDSTCELTKDANGDLLFTNFDFFWDLPMKTYIESDSICIPQYDYYLGGPYPNTYKAYGNVVDGELVLEINRTLYDWTFMISLNQPGTAVATKID